VKLYYFADIFRYERPQAGRYRQHHQFGCEAIGEASPVVDAEVIHLALTFFNSLGLQRYSLNLNSIGCRQCRPGYLEKLRRYYEPLAAGLCDDCRTRLVKNTLRLLDCKRPGCQAAADAAPRSSESLCKDCEAHFTALRAYLDALKIDYVLNHRLVRGLDYYTRTVFEIQPEEGGSQSALGGGGRYDDLISELGGKPTPALGFAAGIERIVANLKSEGIEVPQPGKPAVYIACVGEAASVEGLRLAALVRDAGLPALISAGVRSLKAQLRQANTCGARYAAIIGDDEVSSGTVMLRDMQSSEQRQLSADDLINLLKGQE
jgi:histidyl-tRNA synthetase